jgi:hypothetical protein
VRNTASIFATPSALSPAMSCGADEAETGVDEHRRIAESEDRRVRFPNVDKEDRNPVVRKDYIQRLRREVGTSAAGAVSSAGERTASEAESSFSGTGAAEQPASRAAVSASASAARIARRIVL